MRMRRGINQALVSGAVFLGVMLVLVSIDARVRDRLSALFAGGDGLTPLGDQFTELGSALITAAKYQSIENAPLVVFATVGIVLFIFMFRT